MFEVYTYSLILPPGANFFRANKKILVEKFETLEGAQNYLQGRCLHFIKIPETVIEERNNGI